MAIHEDVDGVEVTVCIDGETMKEYDAENDDSTHVNSSVRAHEDRWTVTKYVESQSDKNFVIKLAVHRHYDATSPQLGFETYMDGVRVTEPLARRMLCLRASGWSAEVNGATSGPPGGAGVLHRFKFSKIETKHDGVNSLQIKEQTNRMSKVGEIMVKVYRYDEGDETPRGWAIPEELKHDYSNGIHEKALKGQAKSHGASLGAAEPATMRKVFHCKKLDGVNFPIVIFKFRYRSNEALKQLMVIERTPEPELNLLDDLTPEERQEIQDLAERLKRKRRNLGTEDNSIIKSEDGNVQRGGAAKKARKSGKKVTIDLTGDDDEENESPIALN